MTHLHPQPLNLAADRVPTGGPKLSLGCPVLDRILSGGLPAGSVTELSGESAAGKTQLSLQLLLSASQPPFRAASLFIHSDFPFPLRRLQTLEEKSLRHVGTAHVVAHCHVASGVGHADEHVGAGIGHVVAGQIGVGHGAACRHVDRQAGTGIEARHVGIGRGTADRHVAARPIDVRHGAADRHVDAGQIGIGHGAADRHLDIGHVDDPMDHVHVAAAHSPYDLLALLAAADALLARPQARRPVRLIVVDSVAALFRAEFDNTAAELKRRSCLFFRIAAKLKEQAARFGAVVVVTNQVVDVVGDGLSGNGVRVGNSGELWSSGRRVCPALGLSWANCVNIRLFLSRRDEVVGEGGVTRMRRRMEVVFAPHLPGGSCEFVIAKEGVFGVEGR